MKISSAKDLHVNNLKILIYGQSGSGKTYLARTIKEPALVVSAESGLLSIADVDVDVCDLTEALTPCERHEKLIEVYKYLQTQEAREKYKWVYIDSLTEIANNLVGCLKGRYDRKDAFPMWGEYNDSIRKLIRAFRDLKGYHVVFTALDSVDKDQVGRRFIGVDMPGKISHAVEAFFDEVFRLQVSVDEEGNKKRVLWTDTTDNFVAKDRSGKLDEIEVCDLSVIKGKICS